MFSAVRTIALTVVRHGVAVIVAWLGSALVLTPEQSADVTTGLTAAGVAIMIALYAAGEKILKPLFFRVFKEVQPGEVPPEKYDLEKDRAKATGEMPS